MPPLRNQTPAMTLPTQTSHTPRHSGLRAEGIRLEPAERVLLAATLALTALALLAPAVGLPNGYHDFADQRALFGLPNAMDVLSNLAFALMAILGWRALRQVPHTRLTPSRRLLVHACLAGLLLTTFTSGFYHLAPENSALAVDRLGISLVFAALMGLACADRISARAGLALGLFIAMAAPAAALWDVASGNMTPWVVLQASGLGLLLALAWRRPEPGALGFSLFAVLVWYAAAKLLEMADLQILDLTRGAISGHSAKHLIAALAVWPVLRALRRAQAGDRPEL